MIYFKKNYIKLILIILVLFVILLLGIAFVLNPNKYLSVVTKNGIIVFIIGLVAILFSMFLIILFLMKLLDRKSIFLINNEGIYDGVSILNYPFIKWQDVIGIEEYDIKNIPHLKISLKNPTIYINKKSGFLKWVLNYNYNTYQSPIVLNSTYLSCSFNDFKKAILESYAKYGDGLPLTK